MDELDREIQDRISRRRMIKRLGAATAVAWTAPVLSTLGGATPAFAQYNGSCQGCVALGQPGSTHCANQPDCGAEPSGNPCSCLRTSTNTCACHSCVFCDNPAITPCGSQPGAGPCPPGWLCALSCCSDPAATDDFVCLPACGGGDNPDPCVGITGARVRSGRTSMG
jgi:hypothetical protein